MKTIDVANAKAPLTRYAATALKEAVIVTKNGKPMAAVVSLEGTDWETVRLSLNPKFIAIIERARERRKREGGFSATQLRREFKIKPSSKVRYRKNS